MPTSWPHRSGLLGIATLVQVITVGCTAPPSGSTGDAEKSVPVASAPVGEAGSPVAAGSAAAGSGATRCGVERWNVKVGNDADAKAVNLKPQQTTIDTLVGLNAGRPLTPEPTTRVRPWEFQTDTVAATLTGYKTEADGDYHLVLTAADGKTMIAEIPNPGCVGPNSPFLAQITTARHDFDQAHQPSPQGLTKLSTPVMVTGVVFFDRIHGQTGVALNGVELHPVLAIR